ncbi:MAG: hypothetical protein L3J87_04090 [Thermoplasmata archaeon]|nr:hypothetical protein [Thermoplasmata archaeon]MCI4344785.1 hypothetical protein [Thermoplasmata archaeon]
MAETGPRAPESSKASLAETVGRSLGRVRAVAAALDRHSEELVALAPTPVHDVRRSVANLEAELLEAHPPLVARWLRESDLTGAEADRLASDHRWFPEGFAEIRGLLDVVERDDHGGNRQAVGQYGRILLEAIRRHLSEEEALLLSGDGPVAEGRGSNAGSDTLPPPSNR